MNSVFRLSKRRALEDIATPEDLANILFVESDGTFDNMSVYAINGEALDFIRATAEHVANIPIGVDHRGAVDISGLIPCGIVLKPDGGYFHYRRETHCEVEFGTSRLYLDATAAALLPVINTRFHSINKKQILNYGQSCYRAADAEWLAICLAEPKVDRWASK